MSLDKTTLIHPWVHAERACSRTSRRWVRTCADLSRARAQSQDLPASSFLIIIITRLALEVTTTHIINTDGRARAQGFPGYKHTYMNAYAWTRWDDQTDIWLQWSDWTSSSPHPQTLTRRKKRPNTHISNMNVYIFKVKFNFKAF